MKKIAYQKQIVIIGFGAIGQALLPSLFTHLDINPQQIIIISKSTEGKEKAEQYGVRFIHQEITKENYKDVLGTYLRTDDFLLNMSVGISSLDLIKFCDSNGALYLDLCIEPWEGLYFNNKVLAKDRSNYALREEVIAYKGQIKKTALISHGANPGMVSHFVKQALLNIAYDNNLHFAPPKTSTDWAHLARSLGIKVIHIAERDTQSTRRPFNPDEFVNTWSVQGLIAEGSQPAELGWGTHERSLPKEGHEHQYGSKASIYLERPGAGTRVRSWTPSYGAMHGFLITHAESISIADYFSIKEGGELIYRPTVHFAYLPCPEAVLSIHQLASKEWQPPSAGRIISEEIVDGYDELGVLLMGNQKGAYWYGSRLDISEARKLLPHNNATTMQVVSGVIAGILWVIENPDLGLVEPEQMDYQYALEISSPYLGTLSGHYTDWTPLQNREKLFEETLDRNDPWQFGNILVD